MTAFDALRFAGTALLQSRRRSALSLLGVAIGVVAVVSLTAVGEGALRYVTGQFQSLGTHLLIVLPGKAADPDRPLVGVDARDLDPGDQAQGLGDVGGAGAADLVLRQHVHRGGRAKRGFRRLPRSGDLDVRQLLQAQVLQPGGNGGADRQQGSQQGDAGKGEPETQAFSPGSGGGKNLGEPTTSG